MQFELKNGMNLSDLTVGDEGKIVGFEKGARALKSKLLAMGLTPGTEFSLHRVAPLGDPMEIRLRGFSLSLRKNEATQVKIVRCPAQA